MRPSPGLLASARPIVWPLLVSGHHRLTNSHFRYNARFHRLGILMALSRRRCSFHRLGILLTLLGGASATTATFNFTSRAPSGILGDRRRGAGDPQATRAPAGRPVAGVPSPLHSTGARARTPLSAVRLHWWRLSPIQCYVF